MSPQELLDKINALIDNPDAIMREVAIAVLPQLSHRVHKEGKDSAGNQIGIYSPGYMKIRTGNFGNAARFKKGEKKGQFKTQKSQAKSEAGTFTKGNHIGESRRVYNRDADPKVILSLTRQMENDLSVVETPDGYGIGYLNDFNYQKAIWCEETYKKPILSQLTSDELIYAETAADKAVDNFLNNT